MKRINMKQRWKNFAESFQYFIHQNSNALIYTDSQVMYSKHALGPYGVLNLHIAFNVLKNIFVCWWHGGLLHRSLEHIEKHGT